MKDGCFREQSDDTGGASGEDEVKRMLDRPVGWQREETIDTHVSLQSVNSDISRPQCECVDHFEAPLSSA